MAKKKLKIKSKLPKAGGGKNIRGGSFWGHRKSEDDSDLENAFEYIPVIGNLASVNDWMDATQNLVQNPSWDNLRRATLETAGLIPFGKAFTSGLKSGKLLNKAERTGLFLESALNYASDENAPSIFTSNKKIEKKNNGGLLKAKNGLITDPRQDSYYTPSSSDRNIQQNIIKQQEINKIKNRVNFPLYKSNENTKELKTQIGDQSEILKNSVFKDQLPEYVKLIKNHPEQENFWKKETLEKAKNYGNDTSKYLAALQILKENGSPYITQNSYFEDKYRKNKNKPTSNFRASKNLMYLEPDDREGFIAELSHAQQLKDNFLEDKNVPQKLDSIYKKQKQTNPNIDYHEVYDKYYYDMPNSIEYDAHTLRQPKLEQRYDFLTDSFKNKLPFMSFTPQYIVDKKIKLDNAGEEYYKGNIGNLRRVINKGIDNIFGTDMYKAFGNDPKKQEYGGKVNTDWEIID